MLTKEENKHFASIKSFDDGDLWRSVENLKNNWNQELY